MAVSEKCSWNCKRPGGLATAVLVEGRVRDEPAGNRTVGHAEDLGSHRKLLGGAEQRHDMHWLRLEQDQSGSCVRTQ